MAKDYMCKECEYNNNGWCSERKIQGLKNITLCEVIENKTKENVQDTFDNKSLSYKTLGTREMLYYIQRQIVGIDQNKAEDKWKALKEAMLGMEQKQQIDEQIFGIAIDYELDRDMIQTSKDISRYWKEHM